MHMKAKCLSFSGSYGDDEKQINRLLSGQETQVDGFHIEEIIPIDDRGHCYFWIFYRGEFPDKKVWEEDKK